MSQKDASKVLVHTQKYFNGILDGEVNHRERIGYWAVKDKIHYDRLEDGRYLKSIYELHHLEMESETRAIGHYRLKSEEHVCGCLQPLTNPIYLQCYSCWLKSLGENAASMGPGGGHSPNNHQTNNTP